MQDNEQCPICSKYFPRFLIQEHADECASKLDTENDQLIAQSLQNEQFQKLPQPKLHGQNPQPNVIIGPNGEQMIKVDRPPPGAQVRMLNQNQMQQTGYQSPQMIQPKMFTGQNGQSYLMTSTVGPPPPTIIGPNGETMVLTGQVPSNSYNGNMSPYGQMQPQQVMFGPNGEQMIMTNQAPGSQVRVMPQNGQQPMFSNGQPTYFQGYNPNMSFNQNPPRYGDQSGYNQSPPSYGQNQPNFNQNPYNIQPQEPPSYQSPSYGQKNPPSYNQSSNYESPPSYNQAPSYNQNQNSQSYHQNPPSYNSTPTYNEKPNQSQNERPREYVPLKETPKKSPFDEITFDAEALFNPNDLLGDAPFKRQEVYPSKGSQGTQPSYQSAPPTYQVQSIERSEPPRYPPQTSQSPQGSPQILKDTQPSYQSAPPTYQVQSVERSEPPRYPTKNSQPKVEGSTQPTYQSAPPTYQVQSVERSEPRFPPQNTQSNVSYQPTYRVTASIEKTEPPKYSPQVSQPSQGNVPSPFVSQNQGFDILDRQTPQNQPFQVQNVERSQPLNQPTGLNTFSQPTQSNTFDKEIDSLEERLKHLRARYGNKE